MEDIGRSGLGDADGTRATDAGGDPARPPPASGYWLASELTGDLPCYSCGYNLRGMSVRDVCPECGSSVRATILAKVDPKADELSPLPRGRLTAAGLVAWAWGGFLGAALAWAVVLLDVIGVWLAKPVSSGPGWLLSLGAFAVSTVGVFVLVKPSERITPAMARRALAGCVLQAAAFGILVYAVLNGMLLGVGQVGEVDPGSSRVRLVLALCVLGMLYGVRGSLLHLLHRSLLVRTGRIDTQPVNALMLTVALIAAGDAANLIAGALSGSIADVLGIAGLVLVAVGSFLLTMGLLSLSVDLWRLRRALVYRPIGLEDIVEDQGPRSTAVGGGA